VPSSLFNEICLNDTNVRVCPRGKSNPRRHPFKAANRAAFMA
jgi:hypothetical protein